MRVQRCKGTRDLSPAEVERFRLIESVFRECCLKWGYEEVKTPTLEYLHLFTSTGTLTPGMLGRVYSFLDWDGWSGERVVLRPDGTIPVARLYIDSMSEKELAKLFYVTNIFIFEETGEKTRERWQGGAEFIGMGSPAADAELIIMALEVLKRLKVDGIKLRLSHAGLIRTLLLKLGLSPEEQTRIFDQILDGNMEALAGVKPGGAELKKALPLILNMKGEAPGFLKNLKAIFNKSLPDFIPPINDFIDIVDILQALGYDYEIDMSSGRGFEYYTGVIFHLFKGDEEIGGGGRYDALIPLLGGGDVHASGFALYFDRLMDLVNPEALNKSPAQKITIRVENDRPEIVKEGFSIAGYLHEAGYTAELYHGGGEPAGSGWTLEVRSKTPVFILSDNMKQRKFEAQTADEVLSLLVRE